MSYCACAACGRAFTGVRGFDLHQRLRDSKSVCLDPAALTRRDGRSLYVFQNGRWTVNRRSKGHAPNWRQNHPPAVPATLEA